MIVATIGRQKFVVASMQDAEALLHILERAQPVDDEYGYGEEFRTYYRPDHQIDIGIEITHRELVSAEEHDRRVAKKRERLRAAEAAEKPQTIEPAHG